jgi:TonB family protein
MGMIHYVNVISFPGGGGGGSSGSGPRTEEKLAETAVPQRETLRDLTTPQKLEQESPTALRHPVEKPKRERTTPAEKKATIQKAQRPKEKSSSASSEGTDSNTGSGAGTGVRIGIGSGPGSGSGFGSELSSQIGLSNFPYTYYLQTIHGKISGNWFTSQVSPGISGNFHTTVYFKIFRNGEISSLEIREPSGIRSLDLSARRAIQSSAPFPPLPNDYEGEFLGIHLIFEHNK